MGKVGELEDLLSLKHYKFVENFNDNVSRNLIREESHSNFCAEDLNYVDDFLEHYTKHLKDGLNKLNEIKKIRDKLKEHN